MYTLVMADPDAPSKTQGEFWVHWIVTGVSVSFKRTGINYDQRTSLNNYLIYLCWLVIVFVYLC